MKISSFYLSDITKYEDISEYMYTVIKDRYYGIGVNSISISRLVATIKKVLRTYIRLRYGKTITIIALLPRIDEKIIGNTNINNNIVKLRLNYDVITSILNGCYDDLKNYINEILEQMDMELTSNNKFRFINYLTLQISMLAYICSNELKMIYTSNMLRDMIIKKDCWIKLSQQSSVFKDYYLAYMETNDNKALFYSFLKELSKVI